MATCVDARRIKRKPEKKNFNPFLKSNTFSFMSKNLSVKQVAEPSHQIEEPASKKTIDTDSKPKGGMMKFFKSRKAA